MSRPHGEPNAPPGADAGAGHAPGPRVPAPRAGPARVAAALLFAARVVAGLAVLVLAVVGVESLTRGTPITGVRALGPDDTAPAAGDPLFVRLTALYAGAPLRPENGVEVLTNGAGTYPRLWADLRAARRSITALLYYAKPGAVADTTAAVLRDRARHGVRVLLVLDAFGSQNVRDVWVDSLRAAGVEVTFLRRPRLSALNRVSNRSHVRAIVVDGVTGFTGGFGLADHWLGDGHASGAWRETNVRFQGPAVAQLQAAFAVEWANATGQLLAGDVLYPAPAPAASGTAAAALMLTQPTKGSTPAGRFLTLSIAAARRTLYISNAYFVPDDDMLHLLRAAVARGVDVRVLTPGDQSDIKTVYFASRARFPALLRAGVRLYEYQPAMMHAKTLVVDGVWSAVGSMNFDNRSLALNDEAALVTLDARVGTTMDSLFRDDLRYAREVTAARFGQRPWWHRAAEAGASLLAPVL